MQTTNYLGLCFGPFRIADLTFGSKKDGNVEEKSFDREAVLIIHKHTASCL